MIIILAASLINDSFKWKQSFLATWSVSMQGRLIGGWHVKDLKDLSSQGIGKKRKSLSVVDILWPPRPFPEEWGLALPVLMVGSSTEERVTSDQSRTHTVRFPIQGCGAGNTPPLQDDTCQPFKWRLWLLDHCWVGETPGKCLHNTFCLCNDLRVFVFIFTWRACLLHI